MNQRGIQDSKSNPEFWSASLTINLAFYAGNITDNGAPNLHDHMYIWYVKI
jgi:hypothetical protein